VAPASVAPTALPSSAISISAHFQRSVPLGKLAAAEQEARLLAQALEDQAYADPVAVPVCLSADRVRRLKLR